MRKPTKFEAMFGAGILLNCAALVLGAVMINNWSGFERQKTADATNQALLAVGAISLTSEIAAEPTATDTLIASTSTFAATNTLEPTATLTPVPPYLFIPSATGGETLAPTFTPPPPASATPFAPSRYSAGDNLLGRHTDGVTVVEPSALNNYLNYSYQALLAGSDYGHQDYAAAMEFSPLARYDANGNPILTRSRAPDYWQQFGGLGFTPDVEQYPDKEVTLQTPLLDFLTKGDDGIHRGRVLVPQQYFEFAILQAARAAAALKYPAEDFSKFGPGSALEGHNSEIQAAFYTILAELGFRPDRIESWPGPVDLTEVSSFVDENGTVCVGYRPEAGERANQDPEQFRQIRYSTGLEETTPDDDENFTNFDPRTSVEALVAYDPKNDYLRVEILNDGAPEDPFREEDLNLADDDNQPIRVERGRWVACGPAAEVQLTPASSTPRPPTITPRPPTATEVQPAPSTPTASLTPRPPTATEIQPAPSTPTASLTPRPPTLTPRPPTATEIQPDTPIPPTATLGSTATYQPPEPTTPSPATPLPSATPENSGTPRPPSTEIPTDQATLTPQQFTPTPWPTPEALLSRIKRFLQKFNH